MLSLPRYILQPGRVELHRDNWICYLVDDSVVFWTEAEEYKLITMNEEVVVETLGIFGLVNKLILEQHRKSTLINFLI